VVIGDLVGEGRTAEVFEYGADRVVKRGHDRSAVRREALADVLQEVIVNSQVNWSALRPNVELRLELGRAVEASSRSRACGHDGL
jgi:hypothetical protein